MQLKRVAVTGIGAVSPYGKGTGTLFASLAEGKSGISRHEDLERFAELGPRVAGIVRDVDMTEVPRKHRRSMSPMSVYALMAAQEAIAQAALPEEILAGGRAGVIMGSTMGSVVTIEEFFREYVDRGSLEQMKSVLFFRIMGHSIASNVALALGVTGRVLAPTAACSTSCQAIGLAYEAIATGKQDAVLCGGADEYHPLATGTFDLMLAASTAYNTDPERTPRPFDIGRDGVVCSEGAGVLLLESFASARARGAKILAEVAGFASLSDSSSIANPDPEPLFRCMRAALQEAKIAPEEVSYVNAHATATVQGDIAESAAIAMLFGNRTPVSSLKGHLGHTMAASGALESAACVEMLRRHMLVPTLNLEEPDPRCGGIDLVRENREHPVSVIVKNNFALGGINCSLVLRGYND
ncbi:MAG: beta-ketoacyl-[acyl-carrier-protein] synthase family protein [Deltaproteobacteria bacterium]|jgi:3-oxoacyl-[acyl-carrier-protein] synthase II|nr:beta-ketoacyl-[acyl-carrier-protein] synthase family protein [Deltaproteobacteria bacterium]